MYKYLIVYLLWLSSLSALAQIAPSQPPQIPLLKRVNHYDPAKQKPKQVYYVMQRKPSVLHGKYISYYTNGNTESTGFFEKGKTAGVWEYFYENGRMKSIGTLTDNVQQGHWKFYYEKGKLSREGDFIDGEKNGDWKYYYENGNLKSEGTLSNNQNDGMWRYYYENKKLKATALFKNGKGFYKEVYDTGQPKMQGIIINGKSDSTWQYFHENGKLKAEGVEKDGVKQGAWKFYHTNGVLSSEGSYLDGEPDGDWKYYYESGQLNSEGAQAKGQKHGHWKLYYEGGQFLGEGYFENGNGPYKEYYDNGKLRIEGYLKDGKNHGIWAYYYDDGLLEGKCEYLKGEGTYIGYYKSGVIKMKGRLKDGQKVGQWSLYNEDATLAGYYNTYYDKETPIAKHVPIPADSVAAPIATPQRNTGKPALVLNRKRSRYFSKKINEANGPILSFNPLLMIFNEIPFSLEYYFNERLGYEVKYTIVRNPFFEKHSGIIAPDRLFKNGFHVDIRQKLYHPNEGAGSFYVSQEFRIAQMNYAARLTVPSPDSLTPVSYEAYKASEMRIEFAATLGTRIFRGIGKHFTLSADIYAGAGVGYRHSNVPENLVFQQVRTNKVTVPLRFGFTIGLLYSKNSADF